MTRIFCLLIAFAVPACVARAEEYISDAFGLAPATSFAEGERSEWAGLHERLAEGKNLPARVISPGTPETLLAFVGPKSAVAGKDKVHAVAIALDQAGNAVSDDTNVVFFIGQTDRTPTQTKRGVAETLFLPPPISGFFHVGAMSDHRQSARADFRVVPDLNSITLSLPASIQPHLPETFSDVQTSTLIDQFENPVGDGIAFQLRLDHSDGSSSLATGVSITDTGHVRLLTRALHPSAEMRVEMGRKKSKAVPFSVRQQSLIAQPEIYASDMPEIGAMHVRVGPFVTSAGYMLNDGTPIHMTVHPRSQAVRNVEGWLRDGMFTTVVSAQAAHLPAKVVVEAGTEKFELMLDQVMMDTAKPEWGME